MSFFDKKLRIWRVVRLDPRDPRDAKFKFGLGALRLDFQLLGEGKIALNPKLLGGGGAKV